MERPRPLSVRIAVKDPERFLEKIVENPLEKTQALRKGWLKNGNPPRWATVGVGCMEGAVQGLAPRRGWLGPSGLVGSTASIPLSQWPSGTALVNSCERVWNC